MQVVPAIIGVAFSLWLVATLVNQFHHKRLAQQLKSFDIFGLVPIWTFFAPRPGMTDYYLLYRDRFPDGTLGHWKEAHLQNRNGLSVSVWNPDKRRGKVLSDVVAALVQLAVSPSASVIPVSIPYLLLLNYITSLPHSLAAQATQFMIMEHDGFHNSPERSRVVMLSSVHTLM
jgi:hypothetical protein